MQNGNIKYVWELLHTVPDPEIPVISVVKLGVIRDVKFTKNSFLIYITPTYSGCPATKTFQDDISSCLIQNQIENFELIIKYDPPWTTDLMTEETKEKLMKYGISPPSNIIICPQCKSEETQLISEFGATACKSLYKCKDCLEPFEHFKCI